MRVLEARECVEAFAGMAHQHLRVLLEHARHDDGRDALGDGAHRLDHVGAHEEIDLPRRHQQAQIVVRPALHDGHVEPVFLIGAVGDRLVEAAVLGLGEPVRAIGHLGELLRFHRQGRADAGEQRRNEHLPDGARQSMAPASRLMETS